MFASKIKIDYKPKNLRYVRTIELPDRLLKIEDITKHIKEGETFRFEEREVGYYGSIQFLNIHGFRKETKNELSDRISNQEKYNENYEKHHIKYTKTS